ncbi:hypothetical protein K0M31_007642 [Melipona bicolor]|uniref:Uncharacterized protein n=1 Tax=Melipona bicolor TaxID=60889 RepID=A0AA40GBT0_9HYME|nr:hypothetical protein K0M31_007642 [Melipona bicolor]
MLGPLLISDHAGWPDLHYRDSVVGPQGRVPLDRGSRTSDRNRRSAWGENYNSFAHGRGEFRETVVRYGSQWPYIQSLRCGNFRLRLENFRHPRSEALRGLIVFQTVEIVRQVFMSDSVRRKIVRWSDLGRLEPLRIRAQFSPVKHIVLPG